MVKKVVVIASYVGHVFMVLSKDDVLNAMIVDTATFGASVKCVMAVCMVSFYLNAQFVKINLAMMQ